MAEEDEKKEEQKKLSFWEKIAEKLGNVILRPLEYGFIGLAVVSTLWAAQQFGVLPEEFEGFGVKTKLPQVQKEAFGKSSEQINELNNEVEKLKVLLASVVEDLDQTTVSASQVLEIAEDKITTEAPILELEDPIDGTGFMWVGTLNADRQTWDDKSLSGFNAAKLPPPQLLMGNNFEALVDVNLRAALPNDETYFKGIPSLGVVLKGTTVEITSAPRMFARDNGIQVWAEAVSKIIPK